MEQHEPGQPPHYHLYVWVWQANLWYFRPIQSECELPVTMKGDICKIVVGMSDHYLLGMTRKFLSVWL
jgi:hypothetical protein